MPYLAALRAENFRCFERLSCDLVSGTTVFLGDNAQGKTSVLEAVCVLLRLQSPRTSTLADLARFGQDLGFGVSGDVVLANHTLPSHGSESPAAAEPETTRLKCLWAHGRRSLSAAGQHDLGPSRYLAHSSLLVWMGNDDLALVRDAAEGRRRYLDFLGTQAFADYRPAQLAYDKALRSRNRLLKEDRPDPRQIAAYTAPLLEHGATLTRLRAELVEELTPWAAAAHTDISESADESLRPAYLSGATPDFPAALAASAAEEMRRRLTVVGPHRDDLALLLNDRPAAAFASEGQQRTIALALKLAQARLLHALHRHPPILLLDDIFGELDPRRRNALLHALPPGSQQLITTTHLDWAAHAFQPERIYHVHRGTLATSH
jgi:DNA replication and repair protein RecF